MIARLMDCRATSDPWHRATPATLFCSVSMLATYLGTVTRKKRQKTMVGVRNLVLLMV